MGVESKHFQNIQTLCVSMNAASPTASISIWKERWEWISVNPADLFMCTLSTKDSWQTSRDQKEENNFWKRKVQIIGLVSSSITILPTLTPRRLPTGHPTRLTEYPKISYCHSNFKKKLSECRSRKKNSNKVLIVKIRGPQEELCWIGVPHEKIPPLFAKNHPTGFDLPSICWRNRGPNFQNKDLGPLTIPANSGSNQVLWSPSRLGVGTVQVPSVVGWFS